MTIFFLAKMFIFTFHMEGSGSNIQQFDPFDVYSLWSYHRIPGQFAVKKSPYPVGTSTQQNQGLSHAQQYLNTH